MHGGLFDIPGAFHAALSYVAIHRGHHTGEDWIVASTYHKSEALSLINKQLDIPELATNDAAIYTVVWLLTLEVITYVLSASVMALSCTDLSADRIGGAAEKFIMST